MPRCKNDSYRLCNEIRKIKFKSWTNWLYFFLIKEEQTDDEGNDVNIDVLDDTPDNIDYDGDEDLRPNHIEENDVLENHREE